jgi:SHS2 domain-containing protein
MRVSARGATLDAAFAEIAAAVFRLIVDPACVEEREVREVRAHGPSAEALLARWIDECLYVHEVEGFAPKRVEFVVWSATAGTGGEPLRVHARVHGEPLSPAHDAGGGPATVARDPAQAPVIARVPDGYEISVGLA